MAINLQTLPSGLQAPEFLQLAGPLQDQGALEGYQHTQGEYGVVPVTTNQHSANQDVLIFSTAVTYPARLECETVMLAKQFGDPVKVKSPKKSSHISQPPIILNGVSGRDIRGLVDLTIWSGKG